MIQDKREILRFTQNDTLREPQGERVAWESRLEGIAALTSGLR